MRGVANPPGQFHQIRQYIDAALPLCLGSQFGHGAPLTQADSTMVCNRSEFSCLRPHFAGHVGCNQALFMERSNAARARRERQIATAMKGICRYLDAHPNASDSLRGVQLWLRDIPEALSEEVVGIALERLAERGEIEARAVAGGTVVFVHACDEHRKK